MLGARFIGRSFAPPPLVITGPYDPTFSPGALVLTQLHCHTTNSDGSQSPTDRVAEYVAAGYGALAITDHDVVTTQPAGIASQITGNELTTSTHHVISLGSTYTRGGVTDPQTWITALLAAGGQAHLAHPKWLAGFSNAEIAALTGYFGLEIHNGHCVSGAGQDPVTYRPYAIDRWDTVLTNVRRDAWGISVDDIHALNAYSVWDMGRVLVWVASNTPSNVLAGLVAGNFVADVANFGVTPGYPVRTAGDVSVTCPGAVRIEAYGASGVLLDASDADTHLHEFDGTDQYVRLVAIGDYTEAFGSALSDRWADVDGTWTVAGGTLAVSSDATQRRKILRRHREGDFDAQVDVKLGSGGTDGAAFMFNVLNDTHWYMLRIGESAVTGYNNTLSVSKTVDGTFANGSALDTDPFDPDAGTWYTMKMTFSAGRIRGKVWERGTSEPGAWAVDVTDTTWTHGAFGFRANRTAEFDNLYIKGFQTFYQPIAVDAT